MSMTTKSVNVSAFLGAVAASTALLLGGMPTPAEALSCGAGCNQVRRECMDASSGGAASRRTTCDQRRETCREQCVAAEAADKGCGNACAADAAECYEEAEDATASEACSTELSTCLDTCAAAATTTTTEAPTTTVEPATTTTLPTCECPTEE